MLLRHTSSGVFQRRTLATARLPGRAASCPPPPAGAAASAATTRPPSARSRAPAAPPAASGTKSDGAATKPAPVPLKAVVQAAVRRWFEDTQIEAQRGDVKQQALLAQMYNEGYGTERDVRAAASWAERARQRGYRMKGVYCEL